MPATLSDYDKFLLRLCIWREARGESRLAKVAVKHVILARAEKFKKRVSEVILTPKHFSCFNQGDPNATLFPRWDEPSWIQTCEVCDTDTQDPTHGANHYYSLPIKQVPRWAEGKPEVAQIGAFRFFKL